MGFPAIITYTIYFSFYTAKWLTKTSGSLTQEDTVKVLVNVVSVLLTLV